MWFRVTNMRADTEKLSAFASSPTEQVCEVLKLENSLNLCYF